MALVVGLTVGPPTASADERTAPPVWVLVVRAAGVPSPAYALQADAPASGPGRSGPVSGTASGKPAGRPATATVLQTIPVPGEPGRIFRVEIGPCHKPTECPFQASLVSEKGVVATHQFEWLSATPSAERTSDTSKWGSGDLIVGQPLEGWMSGDEERFVGVIARPIRLASSIGGILVDFIGGFEHLKRAHFVLAAVGDGLLEVWHEKDGPGPTWSSTALADLGGGRQGLVFFYGADKAASGEATPDDLDVQVLAWSDKERKLVPQPRQGRAFAIVVGPFRTMEAATKTRESQDSCVGASSVRPAKDFRSFAARGFVLVRLTSSPTAARSTLDKTRECLPKVRGAVVALK